MLIMVVAMITMVMGWIMEPAKWLYGAVGSAGFLALMMAVAFAVWGFVGHEYRKDSQKIAPAISQTASTTGPNSPIIQAANATVFVQTKNPEDLLPLKDRIRSCLNTINPEIVRLLDTGSPSVGVLINTNNQPTFFALQKDQDWGSYLEARDMGILCSGGHNRVPGYLNDLQDFGTSNGFLLIFKDKLRH